MASDKRVYRVRGTLWMQKELTYGEDLELKGVLKVLSERFSVSKVTLADVIDTVFDGETVATLIRVILKPYEPTPLHRLWNVIAARKSGVDVKNIVASMPNSQLAGVLADFFMLNTKWIGSLPDLQSISALTSHP
jgi:hypothetical protein